MSDFIVFGCSYVSFYNKVTEAFNSIEGVTAEVLEGGVSISGFGSFNDTIIKNPIENRSPYYNWTGVICTIKGSELFFMMRNDAGDTEGSFQDETLPVFITTDEESIFTACSSATSATMRNYSFLGVPCTVDTYWSFSTPLVLTKATTIGLSHKDESSLKHSKPFSVINEAYYVPNKSVRVGSAYQDATGAKYFAVCPALLVKYEDQIV